MRSRNGASLQAVFVLVLVAPLFAGASGGAQAQRPSRVIIADNVACRAEPRTDSPALRGRQAGHAFGVRETFTDADGDIWYADDIPGAGVCWVYGPLTVEQGDPDTWLLAVADHALSLGNEADFEHLVGVDNLIIERERRDGALFRSASETIPPILELRHLEIIALAARRSGLFMTQPRDPLRLAWVLAHSDVVRYFEIGGGYGVAGTHFWDLYERYRDAPEADQMAWAAANALVPGDECFTACRLDVLTETYGRYWSEFPSGEYIDQAVDVGAERVWLASTYCALLLDGDPRTDRQQIRARIEPVRTSLAAVDPALARSVTDGLDSVQQLCLDSEAEGLDDPRAIPVLVRGLGNGFSFVRRSLAAFGESVVPDLIDVANTESSRDSVARTALDTLRFIVETDDTLSAPAGRLIREAASDWLNREGQSGLVLNAAIDLAGVLDDPELDEILETLASDPEAVRRRTGDVAFGAQRRARSALEGIPPTPRPPTIP